MAEDYHEPSPPAIVAPQGGTADDIFERHLTGMAVIENSVVLLPPCWVAEDVKAAPTLPLNAPRIQRPPA
jgi:hypothetical protein